MKKKSLTLVFMASFTLLLSYTQPLYSGPSSDSLQKQIDALQQTVDRSNASLAEALNLFSTLRQDINSIKGKFEGSDHQADTQKNSLQAFDQRLSNIEEKINVILALFDEIKQNNGKSVKVDEVQSKEFQALLNFISSEDYPKALSGLQAFSKKYPKSSLLDSSQYWIAEIYYLQKNYQSAINEYQKLINQFPKSSKVKSALLKQGLSFVALNMEIDSKAFFQKILNDYPSSAEALIAKSKIAEIDQKNNTPNPQNSDSSIPAGNNSTNSSPSHFPDSY